MKVHELKTIDIYFYRVMSGQKPFEVRKNDRDFQIGDTLNLKEITVTGEYTGREIFYTVTYILHGGQFGIEDDYCVMGIRHASHLN